MGLLSRITNSDAVQKKEEKPSSESAGLLVKAQKTSSKKFSSFQDWAKSNEFMHCGLFTVVHGMYIITQAYGLNASTIASSVSSKDFWNGTLKTNGKVLNLSKKDQELYNFLQFFPLDIRNNIEHLSFYKSEQKDNPFVLMTFNFDEEKSIELTEENAASVPAMNLYSRFDFSELIDDIKTFTKNNFLELYVLNHEEAVRASIKSIQLPERSIEQAVTNCIKEEIFDILQKAFPAPNLVSMNEQGKIKIAFNNPSEVDEQLLKAHIDLTLNNLLGSSDTKITLTKSAKSNDAEKIVNFLS